MESTKQHAHGYRRQEQGQQWAPSTCIQDACFQHRIALPAVVSCSQRPTLSSVTATARGANVHLKAQMTCFNWLTGASQQPHDETKARSGILLPGFPDRLLCLAGKGSIERSRGPFRNGGPLLAPRPCRAAAVANHMGRNNAVSWCVCLL